MLTETKTKKLHSFENVRIIFLSFDLAQRKCFEHQQIQGFFHILGQKKVTENRILVLNHALFENFQKNFQILYNLLSTFTRVIFGAI